MTKLRFLLIVSAVALAHGLHAQSTCSQKKTFSAATSQTTIDNRVASTAACIAWNLTYESTGFSALSIQVDGAPDVSGSPGSWSAIGSSFVSSGANPSTALQSLISLRAYYPFIRVTVNSVTGSGTIWYTLSGTNAITALAGSGGGGGGVSSVFGRTGAVVAVSGDYTAAQVTNAFSLIASNTIGAFAQRMAEIATPAAPPASNIYWYAKSGKLCALSSGSAETCTQTANGGVTSVFGRTGAVTATSGDYTAAQVTNAFDLTANNAIGAHNVTATEVSTPSNPSAGDIKFYAKSGKLCALSSAGSESCTLTGSSGGNTNAFGAYASLPGSATTSGDTYSSTNTAHTFIWDGAAWLARWSNYPVVIPPSAGSFTAVNLGGGTFTNNLGALNFTIPANAGDQIRSEMVTMPGGSWSVTAQLFQPVPTVDFNGSGLSLRDSASGRIMIFALGYAAASQGTNITINKFTSNTVFSSGIGSRSYNQFPQCFRITDDTTNFTWFVSFDCANYFQVAQEARTAFLAAPDQVGLSMNSNSGSSGVLRMQVVSWDVH